MAEGVFLRIVLQPVSDVVSEKYALVSVALHVQESKMLTVNTTEEGLGNGNGHIVAVALVVDTWS